jgi:transcriptional regulator with XRE-family HTH domain
MGRIIVKARQARLQYQARTGQELSITDVANAIGVSRAMLSDIERGKKKPSLAIIAKLCAYYGVPIQDLLEYRENGDEPGDEWLLTEPFEVELQPAA